MTRKVEGEEGRAQTYYLGMIVRNIYTILATDKLTGQNPWGTTVDRLEELIFTKAVA